MPRLAMTYPRLKAIFICATLAFAPISTSAADSAKPTSHGEYLARAGDCISCHIEGPDKQPYAGGLPLNSPFGVIYATNITPDKETGIGNYTLEDFSRALRQGIAKDGHHLYPAMPYPSFAALSDDDVRDLYDYFMKEVPPAHFQPPETKLPFPFNRRWTLALWNFFFSRSAGPYEAKTNHDERWNRGAYLAQTIAHCGACHTPRGIAYEEKGYSEASRFYLTGALEDNWFAANLAGDRASGLGDWTEEDVAEFLKSGHTHGVVAFGNMTMAIEKSLQFMSDDDLAAIAHYVKSMPARGENASVRALPATATSDDPHEHPGVGIYMTYCSQCHQANGTGEPPRNPQLAGNAGLLQTDATSLIRIVLEGGKAPQTEQGLPPGVMPAFGNRLSDQEIADVVSYVRNGWGNKAAPVTAHDVKKLREALKK